MTEKDREYVNSIYEHRRTQTFGVVSPGFLRELEELCESVTPEEWEEADEMTPEEFKEFEITLEDQYELEVGEMIEKYYIELAEKEAAEEAEKTADRIVSFDEFIAHKNKDS